MMRPKTIHKIVLIIGISLIFFTSISMMYFTTFASPGLTCVLKSSCGTETCVLGLESTTNSHVGDCTYGNYKLCCNDPSYTLITTVRNTNCLPTEGEVLYLYKQTDSHAEYPRTTYNYRVCLNSTYANITCVKRMNSCSSGEVGLISLNQDTNSHVANFSDSNYNIKICCNYTFSPSVCGDGSIDTGETCDPRNITNSKNCSQTTSYCNYTTRQNCTRDAYGNCDANCQCIEDSWSCFPQDDANYCNYCNHCGDGVVNCGEQCDPNDNPCDCPADGCYDYDGQGDILDFVNYPDDGNCLVCSCDVGEGPGEPCFPISIDYDNPTCGCTVDSDCTNPWEMCDVDGSVNGTPGDCYDLRPFTSGCKYYDYCNTPPCNWWDECYVEGATLEYQNLILELCKDATKNAHKFTTCNYTSS